MSKTKHAIALIEGGKSIFEAAREAGINNPGYVGRAYKLHRMHQQMDALGDAIDSGDSNRIWLEFHTLESIFRGRK